MYLYNLWHPEALMKFILKLQFSCLSESFVPQPRIVPTIIQLPLHKAQFVKKAINHFSESDQFMENEQEAWT